MSNRSPSVGKLCLLAVTHGILPLMLQGLESCTSSSNETKHYFNYTQTKKNIIYNKLKVSIRDLDACRYFTNDRFLSVKNRSNECNVFQRYIQ